MDKILLNTIESLSREHLVLFLVDLAFNLTATARNTYQAGSDNVEKPKALRGINEINHRVLAHALHIAHGTEGYPNDVFVGILFDLATIVKD